MHFHSHSCRWFSYMGVSLAGGTPKTPQNDHVFKENRWLLGTTIFRKPPYIVELEKCFQITFCASTVPWHLSKNITWKTSCLTERLIFAWWYLQKFLQNWAVQLNSLILGGFNLMERDLQLVFQYFGLFKLKNMFSKTATKTSQNDSCQPRSPQTDPRTKGFPCGRRIRDWSWD